jgi:hypothetical protein
MAIRRPDVAKKKETTKAEMIDVLAKWSTQLERDISAVRVLQLIANLRDALRQ